MKRFLAVLAAIFSVMGHAAAQVDSVVVFHEIHYHPVASESEFVELYNQNSVDVDMSGWSLQGAGTFVFPEGTRIEGRGYLVVASDPTAMPNGALGPLEGALSNAGEALTLRNHNNRVMDQVRYEDTDPWPVGADGSGASLSKRDPWQGSGDPAWWTVSTTLGGTPGTPNQTDARATGRVVFSEVPALMAESFWIELHNPSGEMVNLASLHLFASDGETFPLSGDLAPGAYGTISLSHAFAEGVRLFLTDPGTHEFIDAVALKDHPQARVTFPKGAFLHPSATTPGEANVVSIDDRVVINEIMYHHRPTYQDVDDPESVYEENDEEWLELTNRSDAMVDLSGWSLIDGVSFVFEEGVTLGPGAFLVVANDAEDLRAKYPDITIVGDFEGSMTNGGERVTLADARGNPVDTVRYCDGAPWPSDADGFGSSLELKHPEMDNERAESWAASDESLKASWHTYTYRAEAIRPVYTANVRNFHELRMGFIQAGRCLVDNVSVVEDPNGAATELVRNRTFGSLFAPNTSGNWRLLGNHSLSEAIEDPEAGAVLRLEAASSMNYLNNLCEANLAAPVEVGQTYEITFDAKWLGGSPQLRTEIYYNKLAKKHLLALPEKHGTPGAPNTALLEKPVPTFTHLHHDPPVPAPEEPVTVSVEAVSANGLTKLTLFYSVDDGDWMTLPMMSAMPGEPYTARVPGQSNGAVIQFYVEGEDGNGGLSVFPADGAASGAFVRVAERAPTDRRQSLRITTRKSDATAIHAAIDILSNLRRDATVIVDEERILYNCGVRLRGSMFSRSNGGDAGLNIKFPADQRFRGTQSTIIVRRRNPQEILVKHMANQAGGVPASYNDFVEMRGYRSGQDGLARMEMARFGENYLAGAFDQGDQRPVFKMEGIRDFQSTGAGGVKNPQPVGWIVDFDLTDLGDDKEQYRHVLRMINARKQDDYTGIMQLCKAFGGPDDGFREAMEAIVDTDQWARMMAMQTLCGIADVYPIENPHNFNLYQRPTDERFVAIPWDWDFTFNLSPSSRIIDPRSSRKNLWRLLNEPGIHRQFRGHLLDLIDTVFNEAYAQEWFGHYGDVAGANYNSHVSYVRNRASSVKGQANSLTTFRILSNEGEPFAIESADVTLRGEGGMRVRSIEHVETGLVLEPHWIDDDTWELTLPLSRGANVITLQARDYQGTKGSLFNPTGQDQITVTNTSDLVAPTAENLRITEIMYHPAEPSEAERAAGFDDQDAFEFIELANVSDHIIDLRKVWFREGIQFAFDQLANPRMAPGETIVLVSDASAFVARYGEEVAVAGTYGGQLANGGERLTLVGPHEQILEQLAYHDREPWPEAADGPGGSLTRRADSSDPNDPASWEVSVAPFGTPGRVEEATPGLTFAAWATASIADATRRGFHHDPDNDGYVNGVEYALMGNPLVKESAPLVKVSSEEGTVVLRYRQRIQGDTRIMLEHATDLRTWEPASQVLGWVLRWERFVGVQGDHEQVQGILRVSLANAQLRLKVVLD